jgi:hypothetical protein
MVSVMIMIGILLTRIGIEVREKVGKMNTTTTTGVKVIEILIFGIEMNFNL